MNVKKQLLRSRSKNLSREQLRRRYRPDRVRVLFIGEAPPASGRFFYRGDSGLYRAVRDTFVRAFPGLEDANFLQWFCEHECYLVDLCGTPVDRLDQKNRRKTCTNGEARLGRIIRQLQPEAIVTLVRSIAPNVRRAQQRAKWNRPYIELPYPGRWLRHRIEFGKQLVRFLRQIQFVD
ncbi:MAG TPA: uracil-DNA glycosylase family protein [Terriglobales bacterium]|nr:uracil-DNA glycosylase family protein [Terriglobales bacterium]